MQTHLRWSIGRIKGLTMKNLDAVSYQTIKWAKKSENEKDGRTPIQEGNR